MVAYPDWFEGPMPEQGPPRPAPAGFKNGGLGYCQALFEKEREPETHTNKVMRLLGEAGLPYERSHELVVAHQNGLGLHEFVERATGPLACEEGSAPILITPYEVAADADKIDQILLTRVSVNGTILVRVLVQKGNSITAAVRLISRLAERDAKYRAQGGKSQPIWWPLIQASLSEAEWREFADQLGENRKLLFLAVNPWMLVPPELAPQIKVAQVPVGPSQGVKEDGLIKTGDIKFTGAMPKNQYHLPDYIARVRDRRPTYIVLGPTPGWGDDENIRRVSQVTALLQSAGAVR